MKASRANGLRGKVMLALLFGGAHASAQSQPAPQSTSATAPQATPSTSATAQEPSAQGAPVVADFRVVTDSGKVLPDASAALPIQVGKPLDRARIAESLR